MQLHLPVLPQVPVLPEPSTPSPPPYWGEDMASGPPRGAEWSFYGCPEVEEADATPHPRLESPPSWGDPATQTPPPSWGDSATQTPPQQVRPHDG